MLKIPDCFANQRHGGQMVVQIAKKTEKSGQSVIYENETNKRKEL